MYYKSSPIKSSDDIKRGVVSTPIYPDSETTSLVSPPVAPRAPERHSLDFKFVETDKNEVRLKKASAGVPQTSPDRTKQLVYDRLMQSAALDMYSATSSTPTAIADLENIADTSGADVEPSGYFDDDEDHACYQSEEILLHNEDDKDSVDEEVEYGELEPEEVVEEDVETTSQLPPEAEKSVVEGATGKYQRIDVELLEFATYLGSISLPTSSPHSVQSLETLLNLPVESLYQQVLQQHEELERQNISFTRTIEPMRPLMS